MDIWAIITGLFSAGLAMFVPGMAGKVRAWCVLGGLGFAGFGLYVANQPLGTFYFPFYGFLLPVVIVIAAITDGGRKKDLAGSAGRDSPGLDGTVARTDPTGYGADEVER